MKRDKTGATPNIKEIEKAVKEIQKIHGNGWTQFTVPNKKKNPPILIPTVWTIPPNQTDKDWEKEIEDQQTIAFMQECRERTAHMKDDEKCARCKLRFRCYTEIKIQKKRKTRVRPVKKVGQKLSTQPIRQVLYAQSAGKPVLDGVKVDEWSGISQDDWLKVIKDVGNYTRREIKTEVKTS